MKFPEFSKIKVKYIADNDKSKWGVTFCNLKVYPPEKIDSQVKKIIISSCAFEKEIFGQLVEMGIDKDRIVKLYS